MRMHPSLPLRRFVRQPSGAVRVRVFVRDNDVDQALRILKKKMQREGVFREIRRRRFYEKPSERTTREKADAIRRAHKLARKQAIREGLISAPTKKPIDRTKRLRESPPTATTSRQELPKLSPRILR
jgi:small subunit ribosomal protein S21